MELSARQLQFMFKALRDKLQVIEDYFGYEAHLEDRQKRVGNKLTYVEYNKRTVCDMLEDLRDTANSQLIKIRTKDY